MTPTNVVYLKQLTEKIWAISNALSSGQYMLRQENFCLKNFQPALKSLMPKGKRLHDFAANLYTRIYAIGERELQARRLDNFALCYDLCTTLSRFCEQLHASTLGLQSQPLCRRTRPTKQKKPNAKH